MRTRFFDARASHRDHEITEARALVRRAEAACAHMYQLAEDVARMAALTAQHARVLEARRRPSRTRHGVDDEHAADGDALATAAPTTANERLRFSILVREAHDSTAWREHTGTVAELHHVATESTSASTSETGCARTTVTRAEFAAFLRGTPHADLEKYILCVRCVGRY